MQFCKYATYVTYATLLNLLQVFFFKIYYYLYVMLNLPVITTPLRTYLYDQNNFEWR